LTKIEVSTSGGKDFLFCKLLASFGDFISALRLAFLKVAVDILR
jgi:hypothetical protein